MSSPGKPWYLMEHKKERGCIPENMKNTAEEAASHCFRTKYHDNVKDYHQREEREKRKWGNMGRRLHPNQKKK